MPDRIRFWLAIVELSLLAATGMRFRPRRFGARSGRGCTCAADSRSERNVDAVVWYHDA